MTRTVLIVDDQKSFRVIVREYVEAKGHTVLEADNVEDGLALFRDKQPDLVISDMQMPLRKDGAVQDWAGRDFLLAIKQEKPQQQVILMTAKTLDKDTAPASPIVSAGGLARDPLAWLKEGFPVFADWINPRSRKAEAGTASFLGKPFTANDLKYVVNRRLEPSITLPASVKVIANSGKIALD